AVMAEVKRRSPSAGAIAMHLDPAEHAAMYVTAGARAVSVLTEERHFGGSLADLAAVTGRVRAPVLRKDFVLDEIQVAEARLHGASAVLLIVRALDRAALRDLRQVARDLGLACLIEVHTLGELDRALAVSPDLVGVNARDLDTFDVNVRAIEPVLRAVPPDVVAVAESGLATPGDVEMVAAWGADAVLVGTAVAGARDPGGAVRSLVGTPRRSRGWGTEGAVS
ncbi:MAG TPA: indole-3-glycerol-phosphate synthase, partial [Gemmatimonadales bacterium]|nr:indole-3-glycerol-phosphate synthase [Gemmatimonadales bacterium]